MNKVEKLYSLAGVEPKIKCKSSQCIVTNPHPDWCNKCESLKYEYLPFTAEKQLLLLLWLLDKIDLYLHRHKTDFTYSIASGDIAVNKYKDFKDSIAEFINAIWQDLTEEEKQQIKEILE